MLTNASFVLPIMNMKFYEPNKALSDKQYGLHNI